MACATSVFVAFFVTKAELCHKCVINDGFHILGTRLPNSLKICRKKEKKLTVYEKQVDIQTKFGAVHKVCHAIFDDFNPPSPCHKLSQILDPPKSMSHFWTKC